MESTNNKKHILWLSLAKGLVIIMMVFGHAIQQGPVTAYIHAFHVPLFFLLSGALFNTKKKFSTFLKGKAVSLCVPYIVFGIISILVYALLGSFVKDALADQRVVGGNLFTQIMYLFLGRCDANAPLWFLPCLFFAFLLSYPIVRFTDKFEKPTQKATVIFSFILLSVIWTALDSYVLDLSNITKELDIIPWRMDVTFSMMAFFLLGYYLTQSGSFEYLSKLKNRVRLPISVALLVLCGVFTLFNDNFCKVRVIINDYGNLPMFFLASVCGIMGIILLCMSVLKCKTLDYLGKHTLAILVMHKFPIIFFQAIFKPTARLLKANSVIAGLAVTAISIALSLLAELIIDKICPFVLGKKYQKKNKQIQ